MPEIGTSGSMSGDGKRGVGHRPQATAPILDSTNVWSGRALQVDFAELAVSGLASMYPVSDWSICSGPSWISARVRSHYRTDLNGPVGSPVFACAGKTDLHLFSFSRRPRRVTGKGSGITSS